MQHNAPNNALHLWLKRFASLNAMRQKGAIFGGNCLLLCYAILVKIIFPWIHGPTFKALLQAFPICESSRQLIGQFSKITKKINLILFGKTYQHPLIHVSIQDITKFSMLKKKSLHSEISPVIHVPAPSLRIQLSDQFIQGGIDRLTTHGTAMFHTMRSQCPTVPCGNPLDQMVYELLFRKAVSDAHVILPINIDKKIPLLPNLVSRILAYNVLNCRIKLPLFHMECIRRAKAKLQHRVPEAVICLECGHCLNFGRGKFKRVTFNPNHAFYCRDHKEKQTVICGTTGRIFCSYCGSQAITTRRLIDVSRHGYIIRAVISNNATVMLRSKNQEVDFIIPCLGRDECIETIIKRITIGRLLYLTSSHTNLLCLKCQGQNAYS